MPALSRKLVQQRPELQPVAPVAQGQLEQALVRGSDPFQRDFRGDIALGAPPDAPRKPDVVARRLPLPVRVHPRRPAFIQPRLLANLQ